MPIHQRRISRELREKIVDVLREQFEGIKIEQAIFLSEPERRNVLMRLELSADSDSAPKSVIFKQVLPQEKVGKSAQKADERFFRDWAGIEFASKIQEEQGEHNTPKFYGSNKDQRFILIEDLGEPHVSLVDPLTRANREKAVAALERYATALGRFNASSAGRTEEYEAILQNISEQASSPEQDKKELNEFFQRISSPPQLEIDADAFSQEIKEVLNANFDKGPFTVFTHGDIAPDNVFDHEPPEGLQLMDFEWSSPRNALLDGTYLRMSMPTAWCAKSIPEDVLAPLENLYREELQKTIPEASDDKAYSEAYTHACAFQTLHMMANFEQMNQTDAVWDSGPVPKDSLWTPDTNSFRSRFLSRLQTFLDVTEKHDKISGGPAILPELRNTAQAMLAHASKHWENAKPLDEFPAFNPQVYINHLRKQAREVPSHSSVNKEQSKTYKSIIKGMKEAGPSYQAPTESSLAKEKDGKSPTPFDTTYQPKPPWKG